MSPVLLILAGLATSSPSSSIANAEKCEIVGEILGHNEENIRGAIATKSCVLENGYEDGKVIVEVDLVGDKKANRYKKAVFLKKGEQCGGYLTSVVLREMGTRLRKTIAVVVIKLRFLGRDRLEFNAFLRFYDPKDPEERNGTTSAACGAGRSGVLEKKAGKWSATGGPVNMAGLEYE